MCSEPAVLRSQVRVLGMGCGMSCLYQQLTEMETRLKAALVQAPVIHQDETGLRVGTAGWWVHVCSAERLTHYAAHPSRGRAALDAIGIAPQIRGTSVHDGLLSYQSYSFTQALCNVHHLRDLTFVEEELKQPWPLLSEGVLGRQKVVGPNPTIVTPEAELLGLGQVTPTSSGCFCDAPLSLNVQFWRYLEALFWRDQNVDVKTFSQPSFP